jgi:Uma2 family endonuclease
MTADAFLALPEFSGRMELMDGIVVYPFGFPEASDAVTTVSTPEISHQKIAGRVYARLLRMEPGTPLFSPVDVRLAEGVVVQPDVLWLAPDSLCVPVGDAYFAGPPDLVVEVLSPSTARYDRREKFAAYEKHGVREYWIIDPRDLLVEAWVLRDARFVRLGIFAPEDRFTSPLIGEVMCSDLFPT